MSRQHFFITGLPRSRTSWLASLLSMHPGAFCHHDAMRQAVDLEGYKSWLVANAPEHARFVGDSDSGLPWAYGKKFERLFPGSRWLFVVRDPMESAESLCRLLNQTPYYGTKQYPSLTECIKTVRDGHDKMWAMVDGMESDRYMLIEYPMLDNVQVCQKMFHHLVPGVAFDAAIWNSMDAVQVGPCTRKIAMDEKRMRQLLSDAQADE